MLGAWDHVAIVNTAALWLFICHERQFLVRLSEIRLNVGCVNPGFIYLFIWAYLGLIELQSFVCSGVASVESESDFYCAVRGSSCTYYYVMPPAVFAWSSPLFASHTNYWVQQLIILNVSMVKRSGSCVITSRQFGIHL